MRSFEEAGDNPKLTNAETVEIAIEGNSTHSQQVADIEVREYQRISAIRLGNIQRLLEAILEQNRKGVNVKTALDVDIVDVPALDNP